MPIEIAFEGPFAADGKVSLRTLAQTYGGMQTALERAYLDITRGGLAKGERIGKEDIEATQFYLSETRKGSFISVFQEESHNLIKAIDRASKAIFNPYDISIESAEIKHENILAEAANRKLIISPSVRTYGDALAGRDVDVQRQYGDKSITNNINAALNPVKHGSDRNSIRFRLVGTVSHEFIFDSITAKRFGKAIAGEALGPELLFESYVKKLDSKNLKGVIEHTVNKREAALRFLEIEDYNKVIPYSTLDSTGNPTRPMRFLGHAVISMGNLDLTAGDVIFKRLVE
jgi:hypothetical protein